MIARNAASQISSGSEPNRAASHRPQPQRETEGDQDEAEEDRQGSHGRAQAPADVGAGAEQEEGRHQHRHDAGKQRDRAGLGPGAHTGGMAVVGRVVVAISADGKSPSHSASQTEHIAEQIRPAGMRSFLYANRCSELRGKRQVVGLQRPVMKVSHNDVVAL